jgi:hypothetical protein
MINKTVITLNLKHLFLILLGVIGLVACSSSSNSSGPTKISGPYYSFESFKGKTVDRMFYCDGCGSSGDELTIYFKDKTQLVVWAYKYDMEFYKR